MQELRLVAVSEDGSYAVLVVPGRSGRFALPIDERLRTVARGQFSRLAQYEIEVESPLRPKEIQDRIRAGETAEEIADAAGLPVDRIRRFEGPPLAERARWAQEAQRATVRGRGESGPGPRLGEVVAERLADLGANFDDVDWDSRRRPDGSWQVQLAYTVAGRMHMAEWVYDNRSKHVTPDDDEAIRLCLDEALWPEPRAVARPVATATVTPIGSRSAAAAHQPDGDRMTSRNVVHPSRQAPAAATGTTQHQPAPAQRQPAPVQHQPAAAQHQPVPAQHQPTSALRISGAAADVQVTAARITVTSASTAPVSTAPASTAPDSTAPAGAVPDAEETASNVKQPEGANQPPQPPEEATPARPAKRTGSGRSRRSSVPSWDEIMFGNSRQPD